MRTFLSKSTPSTSARKPCTKCCRACSPSLTMSMPASSWRRMASAVASSLASNSGAPVSVHGAHRTLGVASHEGLGRLPARVVSNMFLPRNRIHCRLAANSSSARTSGGRTWPKVPGRAPVQGAEGAAALAHRTPALVMRAAGRAAPGACRPARRRRAPAIRAPWPGRTAARSSTSAIMRQTRTDGLAAAGGLEMPPRLAPQAGVERRLGQRQMAFDVVGLLRRQPAHDADPLQRIAFARRLEIELGEVGMRRQRPAALQGLHRALGVARS